MLMAFYIKGMISIPEEPVKSNGKINTFFQVENVKSGGIRDFGILYELIREIIHEKSCCVFYSMHCAKWL